MKTRVRTPKGNGGCTLVLREEISSTIRAAEGDEEGINATGMKSDLRGLSSVSLRLTAPAAEGAFGGFRLCGGEAVAFRSPPPPLRMLTFKLVSCQILTGRGGSISRRDHNQVYRRPHPTHRRNQASRRVSLKRQSLFGREGSGGRGASLREAASPPRISRSFHPRLFGREREGGASL